MEYLIDINPKDASFVEEFLNKMKIRFTKISEKPMMVAEERSPYNAEFVEKIRRGERQFAEGKSTKMSLEELKEFLEI